MARVLCISPVRLYRHSFLGGTILLLATILLCVDFAIIGVRAYAFNTLQRWSLEKGIAGLDGLAFSLLVSVIWSVTIVFLLVDLVTVLLLPSRDLQEGTVIPLGASPPPFFFVCASTAYPALPLLQIISIMQVPLVILYLKWELSAANSVWVQRACVAVSHSSDCTSWYSRVRLVSIASSSVASALHLVLVALCARYVHTRPATSQNLIANHRMKRSRSSRGGNGSRDGEPKNGSGSGSTSRLRKVEREFVRLEEKLVRHKSRKASSKKDPVDDGGHSSSDGLPGAPGLSRQSSRASTLPPAYDPPHATGAVHTDSDSELEEKKLLAGGSAV